MMIVANVIHNQPGASYFNVLGAGATLLGSIILVAYALYVYSNVMKSPHDMFLQHLSMASHVAILAFFYAVISAATPSWLLVIMTIIYGALSVYIHFRVYNRSMKPTLCEMVILFIMLAFLYGCTCFLLYVCLSLPPPAAQSTSTNTHM